MKISKKKMEELRKFMKIGGCPEAGTEEVVNDTVTDILKGLGSELTYADEIGLTDGDVEFATLDDFVKIFWDRAVDLFLNVLATEG